MRFSIPTEAKMAKDEAQDMPFHNSSILCCLLNTAFIFIHTNPVLDIFKICNFESIHQFLSWDTKEVEELRIRKDAKFGYQKHMNSTKIYL